MNAAPAIVPPVSVAPTPVVPMFGVESPGVAAYTPSSISAEPTFTTPPLPPVIEGADLVPVFAQAIAAVGSGAVAVVDVRIAPGYAPAVFRG